MLQFFLYYMIAGTIVLILKDLLIWWQLRIIEKYGIEDHHRIRDTTEKEYKARSMLSILISIMIWPVLVFVYFAGILMGVINRAS